MTDRIRYTITDGVADVRLNRPDKMNALDAAMFEALVQTGEKLCKEPGLRAVVLSGEGRAFCAGLDMGRFAAMADGNPGGGSAAGAPGKPTLSNEMRLGQRTHGIANAAQHAVMVWQQIPVPVIAAIHGFALGGGFQVALGADIRLVTADTKMSVLEVKWGLVPDMAGVLLMRKLARADVIRELTFTGRLFSGAEAVQFGIATRVCADPYAEAMALARDIAGKSPQAVRAAKRLLKVGEDGTPAQVLQAESDEQILLMGKPNQVEAVKAGLEKRAPRFSEV
jgi:enoyl-CoA hydratase/carnithine racemase